MKIKVRIGGIDNLFIIDKPDRLEAILKRYNIKLPTNSRIGNQILLWKFELDKITEQYRLARKRCVRIHRQKKKA